MIRLRLRLLKGWKEKTLSKTGKEILLKAVIQAIPTYSMSCFLLPMELCRNIEKSMAQFFWGSKEGERKHHWISWDKMQRSKAEAGMGYRDLHLFNVALLAKQYWHILNSEGSTIHAILKAKYFRRGSFHTAGLGYQPSFLWRSLRAAKNLIDEGLVWRVGDGETISAVADKWVGTTHQFKPIALDNGNHQDLKVSTFIDWDTLRWRDADIIHYFGAEVNKAIQMIPLSFRRPRDHRIWSGTKHGNFTVRSAYHMAYEKCSRVQINHASASTFSDGWKQMWKINVLPRIKFFLWQACADSLPTLANLQHRGSTLDPICRLCGEYIESLGHLLLRCSAVVSIWRLSPLRINNASDMGSFKLMLWHVLQHHNKDYVELFAYLAWTIWSARNRLIFDSKSWEVSGILMTAHRAWIEHDTARNICQVGNNIEEIMMVKWSPPLEGTLKLNIDVAVMENGFIGMGFVLRDHLGRIFVAGKMEIKATGSSTYLEALAMCFALQMLMDRDPKWRNICVASDSMSLINGISTAGVYEALLIDDICVLAQHLTCNEFIFTRREANQVAHHMARGPPGMYIYEIPPHVVNYVMCDCHFG